MNTWSVGDRLTHRENPSLGPGRVVAADARTVEVLFPASNTRLRLAAGSPSLLPLEWRVGRRVRVIASGATSTIAALLDDERVRLANGSEVATSGLWPVDLDRSLLDRLATGEVDSLDDFALRLDVLHLARRREAQGLGSFLGGRIHLFPHQLHVAERATAADPVRWLLADEVGLGKTVEACLVMNRLLRTGRAERCLVVAPSTLTVQWLGELWRKYHQVFALLDQDRLDDVVKDFGRDWNPFEIHRRAVIALELLVEQPRLTEQAVAAGIDLLVVDEAHRLRRPRGHAGHAGYRAVEPITRAARHVLLLSATPLEDDAHGFFRLLQLLRPDEFPEEQAFDERLARAEPLPPCTSSTRRADVGGFPPRRAVRIPLDPEPAREALDAALSAAPVANVLQRKRKLQRLERSASSGAALAGLLGPEDARLRDLATKADRDDPRLQWLAANARAWKESGDKTLVFVAHRETLEMVRTALSHRAQLASAAFHEELAAGRRDIEVAQFRSEGGPSLLVSTECGGEGRNFEFCTRLVMFDLPWNPVAVEQRIGRLDRIGRRREVEILVFVPRDGFGARVVDVYDEVGLFREPLAGLEPELASVTAALEALALGEEVDLAGTLERAQAARTRIREAAYRELHRDPYGPGMAEAILGRVPEDLDELNEDVVTGLAERLGFGVEQHRGSRTWSIDFGNEALVDSLPGVPADSSFLGTFDRAEAVNEETLDFFAAGHPLVEGVLAHLEDSPLGRASVLRHRIEGAEGVGLLAIYRTATGFEPLLLDAQGRAQPEWAEAVTRRPLRSGRIGAERLAAASEEIRRLGGLLDPKRSVIALAAVFFD